MAFLSFPLYIKYTIPKDIVEFVLLWVIKSRRRRWVGHVACMVEKRNVYRVLVAKQEGKRPFGR